MRSLVILLAGLAAAQDFAGEVFQEELVLGERDSFALDFERLMSFESTSVDFAESSGRARLPGVASGAAAVQFAEERFDPAIIKSAKNYLVFLQEDGRAREFQLEEGRVAELSSGVNQLVDQLQDHKAVDMALDPLGHLFVLCRAAGDRAEQLDKLSQYALVLGDYFKHRARLAGFSARFMAEPRLKILSPVADAARMAALATVTLAMFDRAAGRRSPRLVLLQLRRREGEGGQELELEGIRTLAVDKLLFGEKREFAIENVMVRSDAAHQVYLLVKEEAKLSQPFVCDVAVSDALDDVALQNCRAFLGPVRWFFLKQSDYVYLDEKNYIMFCSIRSDECKAGHVESSWTVESLLLEERTAVVAMKIKDARVIFMHKFEQGEFVWFAQPRSLVRKSFLVAAFEQRKASMKLLQFLDRGFLVRDVKVSKQAVVDAASMRFNGSGDSQLVQIRLESRKVVELKVEIVKRDEIVAPKKRISVVKEDESFLARVFVGGSKLNFEPQASQKVFYFNELELKLPGEFSAETLFQFGRFLFAFSAGRVAKFECDLRKTQLTFSCALSSSVQSEIRTEAIKSVRTMGNLLVVLPSKLPIIYFVNTENLSLTDWQIPAGSSEFDCEFSHRNLLCRLSGEPNDSIALFSFAENRLAEVKSIRESFDEFAGKLTSLTYSRVRVSQVDIRQRTAWLVLLLHTGGAVLTKLYRLELDGQFEMRDETPASGLNKESRVAAFDCWTVVANTVPGFRLAAFGPFGALEFEYVDAKQIERLVALREDNLLGVEYRTHQNARRFALFKVTNDASRQLVADREIGGATRAELAAAGGPAAAVWLLDGGRPAASLYFEDGPLLLASEAARPVAVNGRQVQLPLSEDKSFNVFGLKLKKPLHVNLREAAEVAVDDYVEVVGNLLHIEADDEAVELRLPLTETAKSSIGEVDGRSLLVSNAGGVAFRSSRGQFVVLRPGRTRLGVNFEEPCELLGLSPASLLCFFGRNGEFGLVVHSLVDAGRESFELAERGDDCRVLNDGVFLTFTLVSADRRKLLLYVVDKAQRTVELKLVGRRELLADSLFISDYFIAADSDLKTTALFVLNAQRNQLHLVHLDERLEEMRTFRTRFPLDKFGEVRRMGCLAVSDNVSNLVFACDLFAAAEVVRVRVRKVIEQDRFHWSLEPLKASKNLLATADVDERFALSSCSAPGLTVVAGRRPQLVLYRPEKASPYVYHVHELPPRAAVLAMGAAGEAGREALTVYYALDGELVRAEFAVEAYRLRVGDAARLRDRRAELTAHFHRGNRQRLSFSFSDSAGASVAEKPRTGTWLLLLLSAAGLAALLVLLALTWLVLLCVERQKKLAELARD